MLYHGKFSDINGKVYDVSIHTGTSTVEVPITFSGSPCTISSKSDRLFSPIKSRSCTLDILSDSYYMDLYQTVSRNAKVTIKDESTNEFVFFGYLTNNEYDQDYTNIDIIQLNAVDAISSLKDFRFKTSSTNPQYVTMLSIVTSLIKECGYTGNLYIPNTYTHLNGENFNPDTHCILERLYVSEANFFDDDEEHTPWEKYEVLEEILRFMNWSLCPYGFDVYLVDYRAINDLNSISYTVYDLTNNTTSQQSVTITPTNITKDTNAAPGTPSFSLDDVYNKIEVSANLFEVDEIAPDIDDEILEDIKIPANGGGTTTITLDESQWVKTTITEHWLRPDEVSTDVTGYEYQTVKLFKPNSGFKHTFYEKDLLIPVDNNGAYSNCYDAASTSQYKTDTINKYINTLGCVLQHYAYRSNDGANNLPTSLDWTDYLTFFITDDTITPNGNVTIASLNKFELPVLEYTVDEQIMWRPSTGISWLTVGGDLYFQYNGAKYGEKGKQTLNIVNTTSKYYTTAPVDKATDIDGSKYCSLFRDYDRYKDTSYGKGFSEWKMKLQIGNKYWNGTKWTTTDSTFYICYNNNPSNRDDEYLPAFEWASIVPNTDYTDKVGENCYAIPIPSDEEFNKNKYKKYSGWNKDDIPSFGSMKLTIYTPLMLPVDLVSFFTDYWHVDVSGPWYNLAPIIYCKDFDIDYVYTDSASWYSQSKDDSDKDVVYTNVINESYTNEFDKLELKLNTQIKDKPISRSYVCTSDGYLKNMKHICGDESKEQEKNIIDFYYYHHKEPKKIYTCNVHGMHKPDDVMTSAAIDGRYVINNYHWDMRNDNIELNLYEY